MGEKKLYECPAIVRRIGIEMEAGILNASVTDALNLGGVDSMGQTVENIDFTEQDYFKHKWE